MRDYRYRFLGALYALFVLLWLVASEQFQSWIGRITNSRNESDIVVAAAGLIAVLLTSEASGFLIFNIVLAVVYRSPRYGIYASRLKRLEGVGDLVSMKWTGADLQSEWDKCSADVKFNYFWQRTSSGHVQWAARRHDAYLAHIGAMASMVLGSATGMIILGCQGFCLGTWHIAVLLLVVAAGLSFYSNGKTARADAERLLTFWTKMESLSPAERGEVGQVDSRLGLH
jgi:hypothetical protein